jgi:putative acetyltransferase
MIREAQAQDAGLVRALFLEYARGLDADLGIDLAFQGFEAEVADPLAAYETVFLAPAGCAALRRLDDETCELKRLYVRPEARGGGLGRRLAETAVSAARSRGYRRIRLDTLPQMTAARALYESLGFRELEGRLDPVHGASYFELEL